MSPGDVDVASSLAVDGRFWKDLERARETWGEANVTNDLFVLPTLR